MSVAAVAPEARDEPLLDVALELRVLAGAQRGAAAGVAWRAFEIGGLDAAPPCEVQLRDPVVGAARVRVLPRGTRPARLQVLAGEVELGQQLLAAGSASDWPLYAPLRIGATLVALGEPGAAAWDAPVAVAVPSAMAPGAHEPVSDAPALPAPPARRIERRLAIGGGAIVLAAIALFVFSHLLARPAPARADERAQVAALLAAEPALRELQVDADAAGPVVHGLLDSHARRDELARLLAAHGLADVRLEVTTGEQLAEAVADVFRVQGIVARAEYEGAGRVAVHAGEPDTAALQRASETARRDVAGLVALTLANDPPVPAPQDAPVVDDPGKRVAAIVPGESPYVATADGTRYFLGALLPTGHRIEAIEAHRVLLQRDGRRSELDF